LAYPVVTRISLIHRDKLTQHCQPTVNDDVRRGRSTDRCTSWTSSPSISEPQHVCLVGIHIRSSTSSNKGRELVGGITPGQCPLPATLRSGSRRRLTGGETIVDIEQRFGQFQPCTAQTNPILHWPTAMKVDSWPLHIICSWLLLPMAKDLSQARTVSVSSKSRWTRYSRSRCSTQSTAADRSSRTQKYRQPSECQTAHKHYTPIAVLASNGKQTGNISSLARDWWSLLTAGWSSIKTSPIWHPGTLALRAERQSARMSKITDDGLTRSGTR